MKRLLSLMLTTVMALSIISFALAAELFAVADDCDVNLESLQSEQITHIDGECYSFSSSYANPLFSSNDQVTYTSESITYTPPVFFASQTIMTEQEAKEYILEQIKARNTTFTVVHRTQRYYDGYSIDLALEAMKHTGVPNEGDYLMKQFKNISCQGNYSYVGGGFNLSVTYTITYFTTAQQEALVDEAVNELLSYFDFSSSSDYEKIYTIYRWICDNVEYDYFGQDLLKHSAYSAIIDGKAVCQGYAVLFYRLMLELGIDCRVISGVSGDERHAWNIVKLGGVYYNVDATWDAGSAYYDFFLKTDADFSDHTRDEMFTTAEFYSRYPMATSNYVKPDWVIVNGVVLEYNAQDTDIIIPNGVVAIGDYVFYGKNITSVYIPEGVEYIDVEAFASCENLTTVSLPSTLQYIFYGAFAFSGVKEIVLPESMLFVGEMAFGYCSSMETITFLSPDTLIYDLSVTIPNWATIIGYTGSSAQVYAEKFNREFIDLNDKCGGNHTFGEYESLSDTHHIRYCNADNGCAVFEIVEHVYDHNHDEECNHCGYIREVDYSTIDSGKCGNNLTWHLSSEGVLTISGTGIATSDPWLDYADKIIVVVIEPGFTGFWNGLAFENCVNLTSVSLPEGIKYLGVETFTGCTSLEEITIPSGCQLSYDSALFANCTSLKTVNLPDGISELANAMFKNCISLETFTIPDGVTRIPRELFVGCTSLKEVVLHDAVTYIGNSAFYGCSSLKYIDIPDSVTSIGSSAFAKCTSLKEFIIPEGATYISDYMFYMCLSLESAVIPNSVEVIGMRAFMNCTSLTEINLHDGITKLCQGAFNNSGLVTVTVPSTVTEMESGVFAGCDNLVEVNLPSNLDTIPSSTFDGCSHLESITIPESVKLIESYAFEGCDNLASIIILSKDVEIGAYGCIPTTTTIYGYEGSTAQAYAKTKGNEFVIICEGNHVFGNWVDHNSTQHKGECINAFCDGTTAYADHVYDDSFDTDCNDCGHIRVVILASDETAEGTVWTVKSDGTMSISGNGDLSVQDAESWSEYSSVITSLTVSGITSIEDGVFNGCTSLQSITIKSADIIIPDSETAFPADVTIYGYAGSTAQLYAEKYGRTFIEIPPVMPGDVDGNENVDKNDAIYLLYSVLFGDTTYPINQTCDFNVDGSVDKNDAIYLLYHALFGAESYPLS